MRSSGRSAARRALVAVGLGAVAIGVMSASALGAPAPHGLCGLSVPTNVILGCYYRPRPPTPGSGSSSTAQPPAAPADAMNTLQVEPPVVASDPDPQYLPNTLIVRFGQNVSSAKATQLLSSLHVTTVEQIPVLHVRVIFVPTARKPAVTAALHGSPLVAGTFKDAILHTMGVITDDVFFNQQWGLQLADFTTAWEDTHGSPIVVAVVDTGVDASQSDLAGAVLPGIDLVNGDNDASDDNGHGTAVAGVIAARADNGVGGAGACWTCKILPIKVMGANGTGDLATVAVGITKAADMGARVINLSLGGPVGLDVLQQAITYANSKGAVVVAAAGNNGASAPFYPADYPNAISVAGTDQGDHLYSWSQHGSWVDVSAPGCNVAPVLAGGYGSFCGTSSATPLVSGLAALELSVQPSATPAAVATAVEQSVQKISADVNYGRIDAARTLSALGATPTTPARLSLRVGGTLTGVVRARTYTPTVGTGNLVATLRFGGRSPLTLTLLDGLGHRTSRTGRSPLTLNTQAPPGPLHVTVSGHPRTTYALTLSYAHP